MTKTMSAFAAVLFIAATQARATDDTGSGAGAASAPPAQSSWAGPQTSQAGGSVTIFSNIDGRNSDASYWCCGGYYMYGPNNLQGSHELWNAVGFTPSADHTVTRIEIALQHHTGTNEAVVGLYTDNAGVPGSALKTWKVDNLPSNGSCCVFEMKNFAGIPVAAGTQYWIVVETSAGGSDAALVWNYNVIDQIDPVPLAQYCSSDDGGTPCAVNDQWASVGGIYPGLAFAVLGQ